MTRRTALVGTLALLLAIRCGFSPTAPFDGFNGDGGGVRLSGTFTGQGNASAITALTAKALSEFDKITVEVLDSEGKPTGIETRVSSDGSFTLRGLPEGRFTLVFRMEGEAEPIGTITFRRVLPNQEITIVVRLTDAGSVKLVDEKRRGIGHGDIEIEGIAQNVSFDPDGPANGTLTVNTLPIVSEAGVTSIRKGNSRLTLADIDNGDRVHVKGVWETNEDDQDQHILAHEIKLQEEDEDAERGEDNDACSIQGGKVGQRIELEGKVFGGKEGDFTLRVNGNRARSDVRVLHGSIRCNGKKVQPCTPEIGDQVHVRGTLMECSAESAIVEASEVKIQKKAK